MNSYGQISGNEKPVIGIIGGSGICSFPELKVISNVRQETKYGLPSDEVTIAEHHGQRVAFIPRHGNKHSIPPHKVPYKANLAALQMLGVEYVVATCIVGSLKKEIVPGSIVLPDQFVNLTWGRDDSFESDGSFIHLPMDQPYCAKLREKLMETAESIGLKIVRNGTVVVIQGPRFSTVAESRWFSCSGWDIVNMTQYPECYFAKELGMCYAAIAAVTDYDVGLNEALVFDPRRMDDVLDIFRQDIKTTKAFVLSFIEGASALSCGCAKAIVRTYYADSI